jgi:hypothetical protein
MKSLRPSLEAFGAVGRALLGDALCADCVEKLENRGAPKISQM